MTIRNKLDKTFGPVGSNAGYALFVAGFVLLYYSLAGIVLLVVGAFMGFSTSYATIDIEDKKVRNSDRLFGLFTIGKWTPIVPGMTLTIRKSNRKFNAYSQSNRKISVEEKDFRLILMHANNNKAVTLKKGESVESLKADFDFFRQIFGISEM